MSRSASRAMPEGGSWSTATVPAFSSSPNERLEFYISSGQMKARKRMLSSLYFASPLMPAAQIKPQLPCQAHFLFLSGPALVKQCVRVEFSRVQEEVDRPLSGRNYTCPVKGGYKLVAGVLTPFSRACQAAVMLVGLLTMLCSLTYPLSRNSNVATASRE